MSLRGGLPSLARADRILLRHGKCREPADDCFTSLVHHWAGDPKHTAMRLGGHGEDELPSPCVARAAEASMNLGFDTAKPDRYNLWALGLFGPGTRA